MAFDISTVCAKCGKSTPEVTSFTIISMDTVVCSICQPLPLKGSCPLCGGHGDVDIFDAWATLNQVRDTDSCMFTVLRTFLRYCQTKTEARKVLENEHFLKVFPLLPDWLPE